MPNVAIIILNWNGIEDTLECLNSVYRLAYHNYSVIVVDNCSSDASVDTIKKLFPQVHLIENDSNLGYTGGNNIGMRYALEQHADYVWLLNNDTVVESDTLIKLVDKAESNPEIGLLSPVIHYYDNPEQLQFMGAYVHFENRSVTCVKDAGELDSSVRGNIILWGTALFIKKNVIEKIGYLSEKFFAYHEDYDYSFRALRKNFRAAVSLDSRIYHKDSRSSGKRSAFQIYLRTRNAYFLWKDNEQGLKKMVVIGHFISQVISSAKALSEEGSEECFDACLNGAWAALTGKGGAYNSAVVIPSWLKTAFCSFVHWHPYFWINIFKGDFREIARTLLARMQHRWTKIWREA